MHEMNYTPSRALGIAAAPQYKPFYTVPQTNLVESMQVNQYEKQEGERSLFLRVPESHRLVLVTLAGRAPLGFIFEVDLPYFRLLNHYIQIIYVTGLTY